MAGEIYESIYAGLGRSPRSSRVPSARPIRDYREINYDYNHILDREIGREFDDLWAASDLLADRLESFAMAPHHSYPYLHYRPGQVPIGGSRRYRNLRNRIWGGFAEEYELDLSLETEQARMSRVRNYGYDYDVDQEFDLGLDVGYNVDDVDVYVREPVSHLSPLVDADEPLVA
jgi:hypothetical protein